METGTLTEFYNRKRVRLSKVQKASISMVFCRYEESRLHIRGVVPTNLLCEARGNLLAYFEGKPKMYIFDDGFYTKREILDVIKKKKRISQQKLERIFKRLKKQIFLKADNGKYVYLPAYIDRFFEKTQSRTNTSPYFHVREKVLENDENEIRRAIAEMMEEDRIIERQDELRVKGYLQDDEIRRLARNKRYVENLSLSSLLEKIFLKDTITIRYDWLAKPKENKSQN